MSENNTGKIQRYGFIGNEFIDKKDDGSFVLFEDVAKLEAQNAELLEALKAEQDWRNESGDKAEDLRVRANSLRRQALAKARELEQED